MDISKKIVDLLIPTNRGQVYIIPPYQRPYSWKKENCIQLINDIRDNDENYFIGTTICVNGQPKFDSKIELLVIDGQQRLTTVSLILLAIYDIIKNGKYSKEFNNLQVDSTKRNTINSIIDALMWRDSDDKPVCQRLTLQEISNNNSDFRYLINTILNFDKDADKPAFFTVRHINKNYIAIKEELEKQSFDELFKFLNKVLSLNIVSLKVESDDKALMMFEAINNRGLSLSASDLIKNRLFMQMKNIDRNINIEDANKKWCKISSRLNDDEKIIERFFRHYYNVFLKQGKNKATKSKLVSMYYSKISEDPNKVFEDLINKSSIYSALCEKIDKSTCYANDLYDLYHIKGAPSYSLLLYLLSNKKELSLKDDNIKEIVKTLVSFFLRRHLTDYPATRDLDDIFLDLIDECKNLKGDMLQNTVICKLRYALKDEGEFIKVLNDNIYEINSDICRFILCAIENGAGKEYSNKYWDRNNKGKYIWTIEHVLPENTDTLCEEWKKMIADGDSTNPYDIQIRSMHKLGNLTLTGYNSELSDSPFIEKQGATNDKNEYIGYKNGLHLNNVTDSTDNKNKLDIVLSSTDTWTEEKIIRRTEVLINELLQKFSIDNSITQPK